MNEFNEDSPVVKAWLAFRETEEAKAAEKDALDELDVTAAMWAAFKAGFEAAQ